MVSISELIGLRRSIEPREFALALFYPQTHAGTAAHLKRSEGTPINEVRRNAILSRVWPRAVTSFRPSYRTTRLLAPALGDIREEKHPVVKQVAVNGKSDRSANLSDKEPPRHASSRFDFHCE
jgi:hypothetical protein